MMLQPSHWLLLKEATLYYKVRFKCRTGFFVPYYTPIKISKCHEIPELPNETLSYAQNAVIKDICVLISFTFFYRWHKSIKYFSIFTAHLELNLNEKISKLTALKKL